MFKNLQQQASYIKRNFENAEISENIQFDNLIIYVDRKYLLSLLTFLRDDTNLSFKTLLDIFGADMLQIRSPRFEVIYNLLSYKLNNRITVKVALNDQEKVTTSSTIFSSAGWYEREVFDMYGIEFEGHQDMRRILTDYDFEGYPMRKDFPLTGYKEVRYDENEKKVIYEPVKLMQEFRNFDFEMPWEGTKYHISKDEKK